MRDEQSTLRQEIDALKESQKQILEELREIRKLLQERQAGRVAAPDSPPPNPTLSLNGEKFKGNPDAYLAIVEYSDFQCPFCGAYAHDAYPQIEANYIKTGKVRYFFRDFPLPIHPNAFQAAQAARCAGEQNKFWEMHDRLFDNQKALSPSDLPQHAQAVGLDVTKFNQCLASGKYTEEIRKSVAQGERIGVNGTPIFIIGTIGPKGEQLKVQKVLLGAKPYESFKTTLDELLSAGNK